jgi:hypothetical protein
MIYLQAFIQTLTSMGPHYITNTYKWVKMAVWDAPYRVWLDVELEKISIDRYELEQKAFKREEWKKEALDDEEPKSE